MTTAFGGARRTARAIYVLRSCMTRETAGGGMFFLVLMGFILRLRYSRKNGCLTSVLLDADAEFPDERCPRGGFVLHARREAGRGAGLRLEALSPHGRLHVGMLERSDR